MTKQTRYIIARNGQHIRWNLTRQEAEAFIVNAKIGDKEDARVGWITQEQLEQVHYSMLPRSLTERRKQNERERR